MKTMQRTLVRFEAKGASSDKRTFAGYASVFGQIDYHSDTISRGAYAKSLAFWRANRTSHPIPLIDQHQYRSIRSVLGCLDEAREDDRGLWVRFRVVDSPDGQELLARVREGMITGLSIGYTVAPNGSERIKLNGQDVRALKEIQLREISAVIWGADPQALITPGSVKFVSDDEATRHARLSARLNQVLEGDSARRAEEQRRLKEQCQRLLTGRR